MENRAYVKWLAIREARRTPPVPEKDFNYCVRRRLVINHVNASFPELSFLAFFGRILVLLWPQKEVLSVRLEVLCIAGWLTDGIYHTHCAHECHRLPHGVLHATTRASAFNCRQLQTVDIY